MSPKKPFVEVDSISQLWNGRKKGVAVAGVESPRMAWDGWCGLVCRRWFIVWTFKRGCGEKGPLADGCV